MPQYDQSSKGISMSGVFFTNIHDSEDRWGRRKHVNRICKSAANQLNALIRLKKFLGFQERKALVNSFVLSNFNYCTLVWMLASSKSLTKIENLHKRALRFMLDDYSSSYKRILEKSCKFSMDVKRKHKLCIEIYKTINNLNPSFMKEIFELRLSKEQYKLNLNIPRKWQVLLLLSLYLMLTTKYN